MGRWSARLGGELVTVECADHAAEFVPWLLKRLTEAHQQGIPMADGTVLRYGWSVLVLVRPPGEDRLTVCEPDYSRDPTVDLRVEVSTTLAVQARTRELMTRLGLDPEPIRFDQTMRVQGVALVEPEMQALRGVGGDGDTGWFVTAPSDGGDSLRDPVPIPVHRLLVHRPALLPVLALPAGYAVRMSGDRIVEILDQDDYALVRGGTVVPRRGGRRLAPAAPGGRDPRHRTIVLPDTAAAQRGRGR